MASHDAPATVDAVHERLRAAHDARTPLRLAGAATWRDAGPPVADAPALRLDALAGIVAYEPGDLVLTVLAGTALAEIDRVTAAEGQWLALDPPAHPAATIGATVATASAGPLAHHAGTPRDLVLGLEAIDGRGVRFRAGGRVVKNVAGFDLVRLLTGSHGTLAAITELSLRLRARPAHEVTLALPAPSTDALHALATALRAPTLAPLAVEWVNAAAARAIGAGDRDAVLVRLGGNATFVRAQRDAVARLAPACDELAAGTWDALRALALDAPLACRASGPVAAVAARVARERARAWAHGEALVTASLGRGIVRTSVPAIADSDRALLPPSAGDERAIVERMPAAWWHGHPDPFDAPLARRVRDAFDPHRILRPPRAHG